MQDRSAGYSLIEVLVALGVLALATTGIGATMNNALRTHHDRGLQSEAFAELKYRIELGQAGDGRVELSNGRLAQWSVSRQILETAQIAGAPADRVQIVGEIEWQVRGQARQIRLVRGLVVASAASR